MSTKTLTQLKDRFKELKSDWKQLQKLKDDHYYAKADQVRCDLRELMHDFGYNDKTKFTQLPKAEFLELCCMVSSLRPLEPFKFLVAVNMCVKSDGDTDE